MRKLHIRKVNLSETIYHPAFISLIIWIILVLVVPLSVSRYIVRTVSKDTYPPNVYFNYCDLDSDGSSEKISIDLNDPAQTKIIVYKDDKVMDQYNVAYHPTNIPSVFFGDYNRDNNKEIYIFTMGDNTLFLSVIDPIAQRKVMVNNRFIDNWSEAAQSTDRPQYIPVGMTSNDNLNSNDLVFYISTGYSLQPRNLYRYIVTGDSLLKSPPSYSTIFQCIVINEPRASSALTFLLSTQATGNTDETVPFSDLHSWLMVLDDNMKFAFDPVIIGQKPSRVHAIPINVRGITRYLLLHDYFGADDIKSMFYIYDSQGNKLKEKVIEDYEPIFSFIMSNKEDGGKTFFFVKNHNATVEQLDPEFNTVATYSLPELLNGYPVASLDADMDGSNELFFVGRELNSIIISQGNFKDAFENKFDENTSDPLISQVLKRNNRPLVHIQLQTHGWFLSYKKNPIFYLRVPLYFVSYFIIFLFISLVYRLQKHRLDLKSATEREIASLQMKAIKNQIDPHFTLNVLNSIGSLYQTEANRQQADYIFGKYATLIRQTVITSDKIVISLDEEIDFIRNYIDIERFRSGNKFEYSIGIDPGVSMEMKIPRMLIYTFVENSVKYGLKKRPEGGTLTIQVMKNQGSVLITVEDNGPGLSREGMTPGGTGKGLKIIDELADLYYRLEKIRIIHSLNNITGPEGQILGTMASIELLKP